jgi:hypothetical protein
MKMVANVLTVLGLSNVANADSPRIGNDAPATAPMHQGARHHQAEHEGARHAGHEHSHQAGHEEHHGEKHEDKPEKQEHWYDRLTIRGYSQVRMSRLYASDDAPKNDIADRSLNPGSTFFIRRARIIFFGDIHPQAYIYLQPDFAGATNGDVQHLAQIRDFYTDVSLDAAKTLRLRVGQSKIPYGYENMQSSQNRAPMDRTDALNTAIPGERELGVFAYYAPAEIRRRFKMLVDSGLKGSGDYGMVALGVYNGQGTNLRDKNISKHFIARVTYPFRIGDQWLEVGAGGYTGMYRVTRGDGITSYVKNGTNDEFVDARLHASISLYPKPIGFQAEYTVGRGPELDGKVIKNQALGGGYAMVMGRIPTEHYGVFVPYARYNAYQGGRKTDVSASSLKTKEFEVGLEWQPIKQLELTTAFMKSIREVNGKDQDGEFLRLQFQVNY